MKKIPNFTLRIEKELLEKLHYVADYEGRSANMEIIQLIRKRVAEFETTQGIIKIEK